MSRLEKIIRETINEVLHGSFLLEFSEKKNEFMTKMSEKIYPIIGNLVSIKMYPNSLALKHWREQIVVLSSYGLKTKIKPSSNNNPQYRKKCLTVMLEHYFQQKNNDLLNAFRDVAEWYYNKPKNERMIPYIPYNECYERHKDEIMEALEIIMGFIAEQNKEGLKNFAFNEY